MSILLFWCTQGNLAAHILQTGAVPNAQGDQQQQQQQQQQQTRLAALQQQLAAARRRMGLGGDPDETGVEAGAEPHDDASMSEGESESGSEEGGESEGGGNDVDPMQADMEALEDAAAAAAAVGGSRGDSPGSSTTAAAAAAAAAAGSHQGGGSSEVGPQQQQQQQQLVSVRQYVSVIPSVQCSKPQGCEALTSLLWSLLGHGIANWESLKRPLPHPSTFLAVPEQPGPDYGTSGGPGTESSSGAAAAAAAAVLGSPRGAAAAAAAVAAAAAGSSEGDKSHAVVEAAQLRSLQAVAALAVVEVGCRGRALLPHDAAAEQQQQWQQQQQVELLCLLQWLSGQRESPCVHHHSSSSSGGGGGGDSGSGSGSNSTGCLDILGALLPAVHWPAAAATAAAAAATVVSPASSWQVLQLPVVHPAGLQEVPASNPTSSRQSKKQKQHTQQPQQHQRQDEAGFSPWHHLAGSGDTWGLLLELFAVALSLGGVPPQQQQQQQEGAAAAAALSIAWLQHPAALLQQLLQLLAPSAVAQAALWVVLQHLQLLPASTVAALQQQLHQQHQWVAVVVQLLQAASDVLAAGSSPNSISTTAAAAAVIREGIAAQLLPLFHRAYLLQQLLLQQPPSASLAESYSRVYQGTNLTQGLAATGAAVGPGSTAQPGSGSSSSSSGLVLPSSQLQLVLRELGFNSSSCSVGGLLQAALSTPVVQQAAAGGVQVPWGAGGPEAGAVAGGWTGISSTDSAAAAATAAGCSDMAGLVRGSAGGLSPCPLPAWLSEEMLEVCCSTLRAHRDTDTAAAAAAGGSSSSTQQLQLQQQQQQQQRGVVLPRRPCFMSLPGAYQDLYLSMSEVTCGVCGRVPDHPALCLVTGRSVDSLLCILHVPA